MRENEIGKEWGRKSEKERENKRERERERERERIWIELNWIELNFFIEHQQQIFTCSKDSNFSQDWSSNWSLLKNKIK